MEAEGLIHFQSFHQYQTLLYWLLQHLRHFSWKLHLFVVDFDDTESRWRHILIWSVTVDLQSWGCIITRLWRSWSMGMIRPQFGGDLNNWSWCQCVQPFTLQFFSLFMWWDVFIITVIVVVIISLIVVAFLSSRRTDIFLGGQRKTLQLVSTDFPRFTTQWCKGLVLY